MKNKTIRFSRKLDADFAKELRSNVNSYFKDNNISIHANFGMKFKTLFMLALYLTPFGFILSGTVENTWVFLGLWLVMAFGMSGIGLSIMHDANHGSYSSNPKVNKVLGHLVNLVGGNAINWQLQHNVLHHSFTNIEGYDEDLDSLPILRFSPNKKQLKIQRFQFIYAWFFYALLTLSWATIKEFFQIKRFHSYGLTKSDEQYKKIMIGLVFWKLFYFGYLLALPILLVPERTGLIVAGFFLMHFVAGVILSSIFQSAHVMPECEFSVPDENNTVDRNSMVHQLMTTCNFAQKNKALTWFVGGLNYQVEHHLFPNICHVHYPKISEIVKETTEKYNIPYYSHKTFAAAVKQHGKMLYDLGR